jgi:hypothetical protein
MVTTDRLLVLDPTEEAEISPSGLAPRLDSLRGKTIGLYSNGKLNATELMDVVEGVLHERFDLGGIVRGSYNAGRLMGRGEWQDIGRCDAIMLTHGD